MLIVAKYYVEILVKDRPSFRKLLVECSRHKALNSSNNLTTGLMNDCNRTHLYTNKYYTSLLGKLAMSAIANVLTQYIDTISSLVAFCYLNVRRHCNHCIDACFVPFLASNRIESISSNILHMKKAN